MRLSRGWWALLLFWAGVVSLCGIGAGTLQVLGSPSAEERPAQANQADPTPGVVPSSSSAAVPATDLAVEAPGHPVVMAVSEPIAAAHQDAFAPGSPTAGFQTATAAANENVTAANEGARPETTPSEKKLHLRIVRDSKLCPKTTCYKWRVINQRSKPPRAATIDLAQLHLAPGLREAAENGDVQLLIDAVEHHKMINGRDVIIIVATGLTGVTPHDAP